MCAIRLMLVVLVMSMCPMAAAQSSAELPDGVGDDWFARVQQGIRDGEYRFQLGPASYRSGRGEVWQAPNRACDLRIYFDSEGVEILERVTQEAPTIVRLSLAGWGRPETIDTSGAGALREIDGRLQRLRGTLTEGYSNSAAGLEFSWELDRAPIRGRLSGAGPRARARSGSGRAGGVEIVSKTGRRLLLQAPSAVDRDGDVPPVEWVVVERDRLELRSDR